MRSAFLVLALLAAGCQTRSPGPQTFGIRGQVLDLRPEIREIRLAHDEIPGYMAAMRMSFAVKDPALLQGIGPGDLIDGQLAVTEDDAWLLALQKTGHRPIVDEAESKATPAKPAPDLLEPGQMVPDDQFVDQEGRPFSLADTRGSSVALTFTYTRCPLPTFCPRMDRNFREVQRILASRPDLRRRVQLLSISFDPGFDTPAILKQHAALVGAEAATWRFLTADPVTIERVAARFGVAAIRETDQPAIVTHNLRTAVIGPDGRLVAVLSGADWTAPQLVDILASARPASS